MNPESSHSSQSAPASFWRWHSKPPRRAHGLRENFRDQPGHSNLNLKAPGGRLTFEIEREALQDSRRLRHYGDSRRDAHSQQRQRRVRDDHRRRILRPLGPHPLAGRTQAGRAQPYHLLHQHDSTFGALAYTGFFYNLTTGDIVEADTALNEADFTFSTRTPQNANEFLGNGTADLQEVVTHELMHALGFDHSAVAGRFDSATGREVAGFTSHDYSLQSTIYPITTQTIQGRKLSEDDVAGLRALYGSGTAMLSGKVVDGATGKGIEGVHVVAVRPDDPDVPVVGTITGTGDASSSGEFVLAGLAPGSYYLRIEPLGGGTNPFIGAWTNYGGFDTNFEPEFYSGSSETSRDTLVGMTDAAPVAVQANARVGSIVFVTNSTPPPMAVSSAVYSGKKLRCWARHSPSATRRSRSTEYGSRPSSSQAAARTVSRRSSFRRIRTSAR